MPILLKDEIIKYCPRGHGVIPRNWNDLVCEFHSKIIKGATPNDCWGWGGSWSNGYPIIYFNRRPVRASRISWELFWEIPIPDGYEMCHTCDNPECCHPDHITPDTHDENMRQMIARGRAVHPKGDELATKLTSITVAQMREDYSSGSYSLRTLGQKYGVSKTHARNIVVGKKWKCATGPIKPIQEPIHDKFSHLKMSAALRYYYRRLKKQMPEPQP